MSETPPQSVNPLATDGKLQGADPAQRPNVQVEKVYVKDLSLEIPHAPQIYAEQLQPQLQMQISTQAAKLSDQHYEVTVTATVTAKAGERTVFLVEVAQAGIFLLANIPPADIEPVLGISCPTILYPYLRESVSDTVMRAGFPAVLLSHMTFDHLYVQRVQEQQQQQGGAQKELTR
jgi:preprotein translocase subunit SecB